MVQTGTKPVATAIRRRSFVSRIFHGGARGRASSFGHQFAWARPARGGTGSGAKPAAGLSVDSLSGGLSDHHTAADFGIFEHNQKLGGSVHDRISRAIATEPATR